MSTDNSERLFFQQLLNQIAIICAQEAIAQLGQALPCRVTAVSGSIVTVAFEVNFPQLLPNVTIPKAESQWIRAATQVGDYGLTVPATALLGAISGMGGGIPTNAPPGNLSALVWVPVASKLFSGVNVNATYIAGPEGVVLQTQDGSAIVNIGTGGITITVGGLTWTFDGSGFTNSAGILMETHKHAGVTSGDGTTGQPVA